MARKILTYKEIAMQSFNQPVSSDPTNLTAIQFLGRNGATVVFHFDDEKITVQENDEVHEQRVWNLDDPIELEEMKVFVKGIDEVTRKISEIEGEISNLNTYHLFKGIIDKNKDVIAMINAIDTKRGEWLASVGLVGNSIIG
jgi:hypothetical protein